MKIHICMIAIIQAAAIGCGAPEGEEFRIGINKNGPDQSDGPLSSPTQQSQSAFLAANAILSIEQALVSISENSATELLAGVAGTHCNESGSPMEDGAEVPLGTNKHGAAMGYCQATHNAQSPENPRGAMYIAGAIACSAGRLGP